MVWYMNAAQTSPLNPTVPVSLSAKATTCFSGDQLSMNVYICTFWSALLNNYKSSRRNEK